jgi:3-deoxy-D-manno-octulosonic-acid transferase
MLMNIKKQSLPLILLNARITKKSYNKWNMIPSTSKMLFSSFNICFSQNQETIKYLKSLGSKKIKFLGNLKYSESKTQKKNNLDNNLKNIFSSKKIWCAASTHNTEEKICALAHKKLKKKYRNLLTIIIPRHTQRINSIISEIEDLGLKVQTRSINNKLSKNTEIYLVDTYGETKSFYKICKTVFLGGSLINHGGQNPLEPARLGCKILHGPYVQNFTEVYKLLGRNNLSSKFHNIDQLATLADQSFKKNINYTNKIINLKKMGSNILNQTLTEINYYL